MVFLSHFSRKIELKLQKTAVPFGDTWDQIHTALCRLTTKTEYTKAEMQVKLPVLLYSKFHLGLTCQHPNISLSVYVSGLVMLMSSS